MTGSNQHSIPSAVERLTALTDKFEALREAAAEAYDAMERMDADIETNSEAGTPDWFVAALTNLNETLGSFPASSEPEDAA